jgi:hypothetical protein
MSGGVLVVAGHWRRQGLGDLPDPGHGTSHGTPT